VALLGPDRAAIHWGPNSGGARHGADWQAHGERQPVAIALGGDPAVTFCATLPLPDSLDEFTFAGLLRGEPVALARCLSHDLLVPAGAELVIEGFIEPGETAPDGAFGNHTGAYAPGMAAPLLRITAITRRRDVLYPATVVGPPPMEDCWLARAAERLLLALLRIDHSEIAEISQPLAGIFHGATVVAMQKIAAGQGRELLAALRQSPWLGKARLLVLVDAEQDPADYDGVYWRLLNNVDWQRDIVIDNGRLWIDASRKLSAELAGQPQREPVRQSGEIVRLVEQRWAEYGFEKEQPQRTRRKSQ
jgi:4-hydroxy-3-polyprenylbenzoate decarboxylase